MQADCRLEFRPLIPFKRFVNINLVLRAGYSAFCQFTEGVVRSRLANLKAYWSKAEETHEFLRVTCQRAAAQQEYMKADIALMEEAYLLNKGAMLDYLTHFEKAHPPATHPTVKAEAPTHRLSLPRINLPAFSGQYEDWPSFRDLFESIIGKEAVLNNVERLHYLKVSVKGDALAIIKNIATTGKNYSRAWGLLKDHYENKRLLVRSCLSGLFTLKRLKSETLPEVKKIYQSIMSTVGSLESIDRPISSSEDLFVFLIGELFDSPTRREWEDSLGENTEPPSFNALRQFFERRIHTLEALQPVLAESSSRNSFDPPKGRTRTHVSQKKETARKRCALCKGDHFLMFCEEYRGKTPEERKACVERCQVCANCFGKHGTEKCVEKGVLRLC